MFKTLKEFEDAIHSPDADTRDAAIGWLMERKVDEWMNDGPAEVARCLAHWAMLGTDLQASVP